MVNILYCIQSLYKKEDTDKILIMKLTIDTLKIEYLDLTKDEFIDFYNSNHNIDSVSFINFKVKTVKNNFYLTTSLGFKEINESDRRKLQIYDKSIYHLLFDIINYNGLIVNNGTLYKPLLYVDDNFRPIYLRKDISDTLTDNNITELFRPLDSSIKGFGLLTTASKSGIFDKYGLDKVDNGNAVLYMVKDKDAMLNITYNDYIPRVTLTLIAALKILSGFIEKSLIMVGYLKPELKFRVDNADKMFTIPLKDSSICKDVNNYIYPKIESDIKNLNLDTLSEMKLKEDLYNRYIKLKLLIHSFGTKLSYNNLTFDTNETYAVYNQYITIKKGD